MHPHQKNRDLFPLTCWFCFNHGKCQTFTEVERRTYRARRHIPVTRFHSSQHVAKLASSIPLPLDDFEANLKHNIISFGGFKLYAHDVPHVMEDRKMFP